MNILNHAGLNQSKLNLCPEPSGFRAHTMEHPGLFPTFMRVGP